MRQKLTPLLSNLLSLTKPRIVALLCLTGVSGVLAAGGTSLVVLVAFVVAGAGMAGGAASLNCYYDRNLDKKMARTRDRPLPSGEFPAWVSVILGVSLLGLSTLIGGVFLNASSVMYMWLGMVSYVGLYTVVLKRRHWLGVVLGGSAGSFPVLAGWSVVKPISVSAVLMAALVFCWTPAHAWAFAYVYRKDFESAGIPTLPVVAGKDRVQRSIWYSAVLTVLVAGAVTPFTGLVYTGVFLASSPLFLLAFYQYKRSGHPSVAVRAFFTSNTFLAVLFGSWGIDGLLGHPNSLISLVPALVVPLIFIQVWKAQPGLRGISGAIGEEWKLVLETAHNYWKKNPIQGRSK
ncbi:MAG: heme o synthase [Halobacteria archaeon]|nr:heme o synthase [Halobacteria archaeon]